MKKFNTIKKLAAILMVLVMMFAFVACGSQAPAEAEEPAEAAEAAPEMPVYEVLTNATFPPFDTVDEDTGELIGFDMDLIAAIGEDQGFGVTFTDMAFEALIPAIETGNGDIIAAGMWSGDPERIARVDFSEAYWTDGSALLVKADNESLPEGIKSLTSANKVATQIATNYADDLTAMVEAGTLGEAVILDGFDTCVLQLLNGDVDGVMAGYSIVKAYMDQHPDQLVVIGDQASYEDLGFAVHKGNSELLNQINTGLNNLKENGVYDELLEKWGLI